MTVDRRFNPNFYKDLYKDPFFVGFDEILKKFNEGGIPSKTKPNYPPYNLVKLDENKYQIEMAVAGFQEDGLHINVEDGKLRVRGSTENRNDGPKEGVEYIHKGIATREFDQVFTLADTVEVGGASLVDGILTIKLVNHIPENKKPKKININTPRRSIL